MAGSDPGNANLPIGAVKPRNADLPIGGSSGSKGGSTSLPTGVSRRAATNSPAIQENGAPGPAWHSRGYLPHFESPGAAQHVTFHLADSLPARVIQRFEEELKFLPDERRDMERRKRIEACADAGHGSCVLAHPEIAAIVQAALLNFDSKRYRLIAWVVMPNHVHALFQPMHGWTVAKIVASWKKFTARKICGHRRQSGDGSFRSVWYREYWDRYIRDGKHFAQTVAYIHQNPVKARLARKPENWRWSSAFPGNADLSIGGLKPATQENVNPRKRAR